MALDRFQDILNRRLQAATTEQQLGAQARQEQFVRQKYQDLIDRQMKQDELATSARLGKEALGTAQLEARYEADNPQDYAFAVEEKMRQAGYPIAGGDALAVLNAGQGLYKSPTVSAGPTTDVSRYVKYKSDAYEEANGLPAPPSMQAEWLLEAKRTTVPEVRGKAKATAEAKGDVEVSNKVYENAQNAKSILKKLNETENALRNSDALTGFGSDAILKLERIRAKLTDAEKAKLRAGDTQYLNSLLGSEVFPLIKQLGIGARGMDTPAEREFLREVMTGTISLEKDTLLKMLEFRKQAALDSIDLYNTYEREGLFGGSRKPRLTFDDVLPSQATQQQVSGAVQPTIKVRSIRRK